MTSFIPSLPLPSKCTPLATPTRPRQNGFIQTHRTTLCLDTTPRTRQPPTSFSADNSALLAGIRAVAVGKFGSKPIPLPIFPDLRSELSLASTASATRDNLDLHLLRGSFLGSLFVKAELSADERALLSFAARGDDSGVVTPEEILEAVDVDGVAAGSRLAEYAVRVLKGERLSIKDAKELGDLLYSPDDMDEVGVRPVKALIAHVMRVRHESDEELAGLSLAARASLRKDWFEGVQGVKRSYALVAEPFDGAITNDLLTPLVCRHLKLKYKMTPVMSVGVSSGPKYGPNLRDVAMEMALPLCRSGKQIETTDSEWGVVVDQSECSPGLSSWVHMRRVILKRPGIATAEKYIDVCPGGATLFVASAFHNSYVGKMAAAAEALGFPAYILVGRGMEGTIGLGVGAKRTAILMTGWREEGGYEREELGFNVITDGEGVAFGSEDEPLKGSAEAAVTARRIKAFGEGGSGDALFDARAVATLQALDKAIALLHERVPGVFS